MAAPGSNENRRARRGGRASPRLPARSGGDAPGPRHAPLDLLRAAGGRPQLRHHARRPRSRGLVHWLAEQRASAHIENVDSFAPEAVARCLGRAARPVRRRRRDGARPSPGARGDRRPGRLRHGRRHARLRRAVVAPLALRRHRQRRRRPHRGQPARPLRRRARRRGSASSSAAMRCATMPSGCSASSR